MWFDSYLHTSEIIWVYYESSCYLPVCAITQHQRTYNIISILDGLRGCIHSYCRLILDSFKKNTTGNSPCEKPGNQLEERSNLGGNYHHFWWYWLNHVLYLGVAMFCHLVTGGFSRSYLGLAQQLVQRATATWSRHAVRLPTQVRPTGGKGQKNLVMGGQTTETNWGTVGTLCFVDFVSFILSTFFDHSKTTCLSRRLKQEQDPAPVCLKDSFSVAYPGYPQSQWIFSLQFPIDFPHVNGHWPRWMKITRSSFVAPGLRLPMSWTMEDVGPVGPVGGATRRGCERGWLVGYSWN